MEIKHEWYTKQAGDSTWYATVLAETYKEFPEVQCTSYPNAYRRTLEATTENGRLEYVQWVGSEIAAVAVVVHEEDIHVGECLSVQWMYVRKEYRGKISLIPLIRDVRERARALGVPYAYTQRTGLGTYIVKYRGLDFG